MKTYKHKTTNEFLRLKKQRISTVNSFLVVDKNNIPIIKKQKGLIKATTVTRIIKGFDNLIKQ